MLREWYWWCTAIDQDTVIQIDCGEGDDVEFRFTGTVKLKAIAVHPNDDDDDTGPKQLRLYHINSFFFQGKISKFYRLVNMPDLDFTSAENKIATQIIDLVEPKDQTNDPIQYPLKLIQSICIPLIDRIFKFSNVNHLTIFFPNNFGAPSTKINFIGIYGEFSQVNH